MKVYNDSFQFNDRKCFVNIVSMKNEYFVQFSENEPSIKNLFFSHFETHEQKFQSTILAENEQSMIIESQLENLRILLSKLLKGTVFSSFDLNTLSEQEFESFTISAKKFFQTFQMIIENEKQSIINNLNNEASTQAKINGIQNGHSNQNKNQIERQKISQKIEISSLFKPHKFIPPELLGDTLEIFTFFYYFHNLLEGPDFCLEELWACFNYNGPNFLELIHDIHVCIIEHFVDKSDKAQQKFENFAQKNQHSFFLMIQYAHFDQKLRNVMLLSSWPQLLGEIIQVFSQRIQNVNEILNLLKNLDVNNYNQLSAQNKIKILLALTRASEDFTQFKNFHSEKSDDAQEFMKQKGECNRKLQSIKTDYNESQQQLKQADEELQELEKKQEEQLNELTKEQTHELLIQIKKTKTRRNRNLREVQLLEGQRQKLQKKLFEARQELLFAVHQARTLCIDNSDNFFWIFIFRKEFLFMSDQNRNWYVYDGSIDQLMSNLKDDQFGKEMKKQLQHYLELKIISPQQNFQLKNLNEYTDQILQYKSYYKDVQIRITTRREQKNGLKQKNQQLYQFLIQSDYQQRITLEFQKEFLMYLEKQFQIHLDMREGFWMDPRQKDERFFQYLNKIDNVNEMNEFIQDCEKEFSTMFVFQNVSDSESNQNSQKSSDQEDSEDEDIPIRRNNQTNIFKENKQENQTRFQVQKKANLKFWNFYLQNLKSMWRDYLNKNKQSSGIFFALLIFSQILLKFIVNKTEKLKEIEEKKRETKQREENTRRLQKKNKRENNDNFYSRYNLRKNRFANGKQRINRCQECDEKIKKDKIKCYACEQNFHSECVDYYDQDETKWRCQYCREQIANSHMTRQLRKKLKFYDQYNQVINNKQEQSQQAQIQLNF